MKSTCTQKTEIVSRLPCIIIDYLLDVHGFAEALQSEMAGTDQSEEVGESGRDQHKEEEKGKKKERKRKVRLCLGHFLCVDVISDHGVTCRQYYYSSQNTSMKQPT